MSLRARITLGYVILVVSSFSLILYLVLQDVRPRYLEAVEESTVDTAELLAALLSEQVAGDAVRVEHVQRAMENISRRSLRAKIFDVEKRKVGLIVYVTDKKGTLIYDSTGKSPPGTDFSKWNDIHLTLQGKYGARSSRSIPNDPTTSTLYVGAPIERDGVLLGAVSVGKPKTDVSFFIEVARRKSILVLVLVGLSAVGLALVLSHWITQPIRKLTEYVGTIQRGKPSRLPELGEGEMGTLGTALETMRAKLEGKNYIEDYIRSLTHEMKSPLTAIRGASEILRDDTKTPTGMKFLANIDTEAGRLQNLVERMLELSRLENVRALNRENVPLRKLLEETVSAHETQLAKKRIAARIDATPAVSVLGDPFLIRQAVANLLSNAIDFSPADSAIELGAVETDQNVTLFVKDQGSGIPEFALPKVFDKFFSLERAETGKKSTGLGLPFVKEVASLHGGQVKLSNRHPGLEASLEIPRAPS